MNNHQLRIESFYTAFSQLDWRTMHACYHHEATFYDPVFHELNFRQTKAMWHMLCENAKDFSLTYSDVATNGNTGRCKWNASYLFSRTGKRVQNHIESNFVFDSGLIFSHRDSFDLWRWSRMALGNTGLLLGWSGFFQGKLHQTARYNLLKFIEKHPEYQ